uniref:Uncharacterized protein n=1 Tax=Anopheles melas TaxID=34690 RepID=A0A182U3P5_9DIPT
MVYILIGERHSNTAADTDIPNVTLQAQENFAVDPYCGGGINSGGQWPIPNCGGPMCHHGPGPGLPPGAGAGPVTVGQGVVGPGGAGPGMGTLVHGPSQLSLHGPPLPPPPLCNPCSNTNSFNSVPLPGPSRWGPRTSCPVHSPFRIRVPNGSICSGHQNSSTFQIQMFRFQYYS